MKRPLFWKLLIGSWATLIIVGLGNGLQFGAYASSMAPWGKALIQRIERLELASAAEILRQQGPAAMAAYKTRLPPGERLDVVKGALPTPHHSMHDNGVTQVVSTQWGVYSLTYHTPSSALLPPNLGVNSLRLPLELLALDLVGVSFFSFIFAHYLVRPIQRLRAGLERVAQGDLTVRVFPQLGRRRDELSELAYDFDVMAERIQLLLEARERLLHDVSHEFRSPLTRLMLAVDLARQNPGRCIASLGRIESEAQRLNEMVGELLTVARAEFSAAGPETYCAVPELLAAVAADATYEAEAKEVTVAVEIPDPQGAGMGLVTKGSAELLRKGLDNVLRNAVKFSQAGQEVVVRLTPPVAPSTRLRIEVSDRGPGVPEGDLERIFEPFVRLDGQQPGGGYGLGLAIARSAALAHKGAVSAANRRGGGLSVIFELPVDASGAALPVAELASLDR